MRIYLKIELPYSNILIICNRNILKDCFITNIGCFQNKPAIRWGCHFEITTFIGGSSNNIGTIHLQQLNNCKRNFLLHFSIKKRAYYRPILCK